MLVDSPRNSIKEATTMTKECLQRVQNIAGLEKRTRQRGKETKIARVLPLCFFGRFFFPFHTACLQLLLTYGCAGQTTVDAEEFINILHIAIKCVMYAPEIFISIDLCEHFCIFLIENLDSG